MVILPFRNDKEPKVWAIHHLLMHDVGSTRPWPFEAALTNGVPPGEIDVSGTFGPWHRDEPGDTPLEGAFIFARADLGVFKGISGTLSSQGDFGGTLAELEARGETDTPDFTIKVGGHPFPLHVNYQALIDGTNGDTRLKVIDAWFLGSYLHATGAVLGAPKGHHGRTVTLDVAMDKSRIEDIMTMVVATATPPMVGGLTLTTTFVLPPGENERGRAPATGRTVHDQPRAVHQRRRAGKDRRAEQAWTREDLGAEEGACRLGLPGTLHAGGRPARAAGRHLRRARREGRTGGDVRAQSRDARLQGPSPARREASRRRRPAGSPSS